MYWLFGPVKSVYAKMENYKAMWGGMSKDALLEKYNLNSEK